MSINLTEAQQTAVVKSGNILVSAAAGSGKTAVLVERVINKLCSKTNPIRADKLLIVTFTNAAAAEMRGRIEKRLDEECEKNPNDTGLLLQKHLLASAKICTIDSFCIDFVRENFEKLGIAPDFKITDNSILKPINERVLSEILTEYFDSKDPEFAELLDIAGSEFDEKKFSELILNLYDYSCHLPFPEKWFDALLNDYQDGKFSSDNQWRVFTLKTARKTVDSLRKNLAKAVDLVCVDSKMSDKFLPIFIVAAEQIDDLADICLKGNWNEIYKKINSFSLPNIPSVKGSNDIPQVKAAKEIYDYIRKKGIENLYHLFYADEEFISAQFKKLFPAVKLLIKILKEFSVKIFATYIENNMFTFHNTEAMALKLLCCEKDDEIVINPDAYEFLDLFDEVCVDEYQDTNDLQNMLFYVLSNKDSKLFAVGDIKQSIYGFRGANPEHFLKKKNNRVSADIAKDGEPLKIILGNNFRSRTEICRFINYFFSLFMSGETGKIIYDEEEMLIPSGIFPCSEIANVSIDIVEADANSDKKVIEARSISRFIKKTMKSGKVIRENETQLREAKYSDFTILLRSIKNNAGILAEELRKQGVPVNFSSEGFCEYVEIAVMLSLLKIIDNPSNDVELLSVMMSPIFGFSADDMAKIRIDAKDIGLYSAVSFAAENGNAKAENFLSRIQKYRLYAVTNTLPQLLYMLYDDTGYLNTVLAYNDGVRRRNNLLLLVQYAESYSEMNSDYSGFVDYMLKQNEKGLKSSGITGGENAVRIMSIHASKGLQFPVCIIANTASDFNNQESRESSVFSSDYGIGFKYFDEKDKCPYTTIAREVILTRLKQEHAEEELRLLYVAMTRAIDILHFSAVTTDADKNSQKISNRLLGSESEISADFFSRTKSYFDWLLTAVLLHRDGKELRGTCSSLICKETLSHISVNIIPKELLPESTLNEDFDEKSFDKELFKITQNNILFDYPYNELLNAQSKVSVSVLANKSESDKYSFTAKPSFMCDGGISANDKGTAMHKVIEFFDFSKCNEPKIEIERLVEWQYISETEAQSVDINLLNDFFASEIFSRMENSAIVKREMRFLTELPAKLADSNISEKFADEKIIVQGAVDVCFVEDDGVVILDFKTDHIDDPQKLAKTYAQQLDIYAMALAKIFEMPVKEKVIYSFFLSKEIKLP